MSDFVVGQVLGKFLANYHLGQAVFLLFILSVPAGIVKKSGKLTAILFVAFGGLFLIVPSISDAEPLYSFLGVILMILGPMAYTSANR